VVELAKMGPDQNIFTLVGSIFCVKFSIFFPSGQKKSLWVGSVSTWVKGGSTSYLRRVKSKLGLG